MKLKCKKVVQEWQKTLYSINWNLLVEISKNNTFSVPQAFKTAYNSYALKSSTLKTYKSHKSFLKLSFQILDLNFSLALKLQKIM
jgi:hypothetical protein